MNDKKKYSQFYSKNTKELFNNIIDLFLNDYNKNISIIEPCCGEGDIIKFLKTKNINNFELYDIKPKYENTQKLDTILNQIDLNNKYIITNPPYTAKNKLTKEQKNLYKDYLNDIDDLYQIYIKQIINSNVISGILILPINFLFSNNNKIRKEFILKYQIVFCNLFEKQIFSDTTSAICIFYFKIRNKQNNNLNDFIFKSNLIRKNEIKEIIIELSNKNNYYYGYEVYKKIYEDYVILSRYDKEINNEQYLTHIKIYTLDPNMKTIYDNEPKINLLTDRSFINIVSSLELNEYEEKYIIKKFNEILLYYRNKYNSLFMSSYREFSRKRLSFNLIYIWLENIINELFEIKYNNIITNDLIFKLCEIYDNNEKELITFDELYEKINIELINRNVNNFYENIDKNKIKKNYENNILFKQKYKTFDEFYNYIINHKDDVFIQTLFIKNSSKQSFHEILQIYLMEKKLNIKFDIHIKDKLTNTKSFDGINKENKIYLVCKYINEYGDFKDNQINDLIKFNTYSKETNYLIYIVISGNYGKKKIKQLLENNLNDNVKIEYL